MMVLKERQAKVKNTVWLMMHASANPQEMHASAKRGGRQKSIFSVTFPQ
jgi:hypothetical protein